MSTDPRTGRNVLDLTDHFPTRSDTPNTFNGKIIKYLYENRKKFKQTIRKTDEGTLAEYQVQWTVFLVQNWYKYCLYREFKGYSKTQTFYFQSTKVDTNDQIDPLLAFEDDYLIDNSQWGSVGLEMWLILADMIYHIHKKDVENFDIKTLDMDRVIRETTLLWTPTCFDMRNEETQQKIRSEFLLIMARVGKCIALSRTPVGVYVKRASCDLYIHTITMIDPEILLGQRETSSLMITRNQREEVHETMEEYLDDMNADYAQKANCIRTLLLLCGYPGIQKLYILKKIYGEDSYFINQFKIHLLKSARQEDAISEFQPQITSELKKFNPLDHDLTFFWRRESNSTRFETMFKLWVFHTMIQTKMVFQGFLPRMVRTLDMYARNQEFLDAESCKFPMILCMNNFQLAILNNGKLEYGNVEGILFRYSEYIQKYGIPKRGTMNYDKSIYQWYRLFPSICQRANIINEGAIVRNPVKFGKRRYTNQQQQQQPIQQQQQSIQQQQPIQQEGPQHGDESTTHNEIVVSTNSIDNMPTEQSPSSNGNSTLSDFDFRSVPRDVMDIIY